MMKQQAASVWMGLLAISLYFLVKFVVYIQYFSARNSEIIETSSTTQLKLSGVSSALAVLFFILTFAYRSMQIKFSWKALRITLSLSFVVILTLVTFENWVFASHMQLVRDFNNSIPSSSSLI